MNLPIRHHNQVLRPSSFCCTAHTNGAANRHSHDPRSKRDAKRGRAKGIVMRNFLSLALACLLAVSNFAIAEAKDERPRKVRLPVHSRTTAYAVQTVSVRTGCFSPRLEGILAHIAVKTGRRPLVTSGHRPRSHRSGSMHRLCQAAAASAAIVTVSFMSIPVLNANGPIAANRKVISSAPSAVQEGAPEACRRASGIGWRRRIGSTLALDITPDHRQIRSADQEGDGEIDDHRDRDQQPERGDLRQQ